MLGSCLRIGLVIGPIPNRGFAAVFGFQQLSTEPARSY